MGYFDFVRERAFAEKHGLCVVTIARQPQGCKSRAKCRLDSHKFELTKVRINRGGYTDSGQYFGIGAPLWHGECMCGHHCVAYFRAPDRDAAKALVRGHHDRKARFYR
jgi:hypothetical protein